MGKHWEKCYLFHGLFQLVLCGVYIVPIHLHALCICQKDNICVTLLCMYTQRDVPHLEQCLQMCVQTYAEIVSHGKHCLWCLTSCNWTVKLCVSLLCLSTRKVSTTFLSEYFFTIALSLFLDIVFSVYWVGFLDITQILEMHEDISLTELLHQGCTRFNYITLPKLALLFFK